MDHLTKLKKLELPQNMMKCRKINKNRSKTSDYLFFLRKYDKYELFQKSVYKLMVKSEGIYYFYPTRLTIIPQRKD